MDKYAKDILERETGVSQGRHRLMQFLRTAGGTAGMAAVLYGGSMKSPFLADTSGVLGAVIVAALQLSAARG